MMEWSYWEQKSFLSNIDYLIVGGGFVGLFTALALREKNNEAHIVILERGSLSNGASTRNAGFACFGSLTEIMADEKIMSRDRVYDMIKMRYDGLKRSRQLLGDETIAYDACGGFEIFYKDDIEIYNSCLAYMPKINAVLKGLLNVNIDVFEECTHLADDLGLKNVHGLIKNKLEGSINTGALYKALRREVVFNNIEILNGVEVHRVDSLKDRPICILKDGRHIAAQNIVIATNAFTRQLFPHVAVRAVRNQVLVTKSIPGLKLRGTFHYNEGFVYLRNLDDNRILIGGGRNLDPINSETDQFGENKKLLTWLKQYLESYISLENESIEIEYNWSGILGVYEDKMPIIEKMTDKVIFVVRMGGMGVAISSEVAQRVVDLLEKDN